MHRHDHFVFLGNHKHLLADDDPRKGLAHVLHHLAAVDAVGDDGLASLGVVDNFGSALLVLPHADVGVLQVQTVGQLDPLAAVNLEQTASAKCGYAVLHYRTQNIVSLSPQLCDLWVRCAVRINDAFRFVQFDLDTKILELRLELRRTHTVPTAKDCCFSNEPLRC